MDKDILEKKIKEINEILDAYLPEDNGKNTYLLNAMKHSVSGGGKRIRPMLLNEAYIMFTGKECLEVTAPFMAALEYIHSYSLVHDDLPCMDDAALRRGQPATHVKFGEAFGVLAGDALLHYAFEVMADDMSNEHDGILLKRKADAFSFISHKAGMGGMVSGQALDVLSEIDNDIELGPEQIEYIYEGKTSALIEAALMAGAALAGAGAEQISSMEKAGRAIGLAFQIEDDILDVTGTVDMTGKAPGADDKNNKKTYVELFGLEKARDDAKKYTEDAIKIFKDRGEYKNTFLNEMVSSLVDRKY